MAGLFGISVNPDDYRGKFNSDLFYGTFYLQHLGEEYSGLAVKKPNSIHIQTHKGLFRPMFGSEIGEFRGTAGIGYCGLAREPFLVNFAGGEICACFSGNIINKADLLRRFKGRGHAFSREDDIELITTLIAQKKNVVDGIRYADSKIKGAFAMLILTEQGVYAYRSSSGHWPLVLGEKKGAVAVSSESISFINQGFRLCGDVMPGEIVWLQEGSLVRQLIMPAESARICSFLWVYTDSPVSVVHGISVSEVRRRLGALLAKKDIEAGFIPDVVMPVPDSGRFHAIGYHQEFCRAMNEGTISRMPVYAELLVKFPYAGRSFTPSTPKQRKLEANVKIVPIGDISYEGKEVVVDDDSIVRGVQTREGLTRKLSTLGVKGIHLRISDPELCSHCPWGKTTQKGEVLVTTHPTNEQRVKFLRVTSLRYNTIEDLVEAIGLPKSMLCFDCNLPEQ
jgi:amidophosphoribosyltransferase